MYSTIEEMKELLASLQSVINPTEGNLQRQLLLAQAIENAAIAKRSI